MRKGEREEGGKEGGMERERGREGGEREGGSRRERQTETETDTQRDRQTDRQTETDRQRKSCFCKCITPPQSLSVSQTNTTHTVSNLVFYAQSTSVVISGW